jgi:tripartite-type tricarboxylate transporter receptor subunit TctC
MKAMVAALTLALASPALADPVRDFYAGPGKQMKFLIRTPPGGGYDLLSRLLARHMGRHIPGEPTLTPINMPGGGGIVAANYMASVAPRDGTVISIISQGLASDQALGLSPQLTADLRGFNWIANVDVSPQLLAVWHTSPTKTFEDAKHRVTSIGTSGAGSASVQYPAFYNNVLGTKFKIIFGYAGGQDIDFAMEKGEVEGRGTNPYSDYMADKPDWLPNKLIIPLMQAATVREPALPDTPLLADYPVRPEDKPLTLFMSRASTVGRPLATTPGAPPERVEALRRAFEETLRDPEYIADARREHANLHPMTGPELAALIASILDTPADIRARVKDAIQPRDADVVK